MAGFRSRRAAACGVAGLCLALGGCAQWSGQAALASGYAALVAGWDRDGDALLDRGEVTAMVEAGFPPEERKGAAWDALRAWLVALWFEQDRNGDGRLARDELVRVPLATRPASDGGPGF